MEQELPVHANSHSDTKNANSQTSNTVLTMGCNISSLYTSTLVYLTVGKTVVNNFKQVEHRVCGGIMRYIGIRS